MAFLSLSSCEVFISFRIRENDGAAQALKLQLESRGINTFVCNTEPCADVMEDVSAALESCKLFVVLGTESYGEKTGSFGFSTFNELCFAIQKEKKIFLIKRCDEFKVTTTVLWLPFTKLHALWMPHTKMPEDLVDEIVFSMNNIVFSADNADIDV
jgi:hypothetical protein